MDLALKICAVVVMTIIALFGWRGLRSVGKMVYYDRLSAAIDFVVFIGLVVALGWIFLR